jgi:ATP-binding cassette, subfamily F, member 3
MQRVNREAGGGAALQFAFKPPERSGRVVFELSQARMVAGERILLEGGELWLERGEHVSLVGPNGAGKTTLIEALAGIRQLGAGEHSGGPGVEGRGGPVVEGKLRTGHNVKIAFLSQHAEELGSRTARTVLEAAQHATGLTPGKARALLGRFLFSGEEAEKALDVLSGGERRRLALAILVASGANCLILDEPTNHLDLESREALEQALSEFQGAVLLVSHDRALLDAVGTRTVAFEDRALHSFVGGWPEYLRAREEWARERTSAKATPPRSPKAKAPPRPASAKRAADGRQQHLEQEIGRAEAALKRLEDELADPAAWAGQAASADSAARHEQARRAVDELYRQLEEIAG